MSRIGRPEDAYAWFEPFGGDGSKRWPLTEVIYRDPDTGELLTVKHDMERLKQTPPDEWRRMFEQRGHTTEWPYGSGVWGKRELANPDGVAQ